MSPCTERLGALSRLPLATLYLTERCNSRCVTCDHWRTGRTDLTLESVTQIAYELEQLGARWVMLSGGEPLVHPQWGAIAELLRSRGIKVGLLTSGLALAKHAARVVELFDDVTVSLDGIDRESYASIRGVDAFDAVCRGVRLCAALGLAPNLRVTLQRRNYRYLPEFVELAKVLGAARVSFLAVDSTNPHAFGRHAAVASPAPQAEDLTELGELIGALEQQLADDFRSGFIAESPRKLRAILQHFAAALGQAPPPPVVCNAPEFSAVIGASGHVQPCFFIPGPAAPFRGAGLIDELNSSEMRVLRGDIRDGRRQECQTCVCSMWRDPSQLEHFRPNSASSATVA